MDAVDINYLQKFVLSMGKSYSEGHNDLTIQAGGKEFKAYKNVLMAHSEIFQVMLSSPNSTEAQQSLVKIEDISADVIQALIDWMHFLKLDNLEEIACDLYKAAYAYKILPLMDRCVRAMSSNLTIENLASRIILAYTYELKISILRFVQEDYRNVCKLIVSNEWIEFTAENFELAREIAQELYK